MQTLSTNPVLVTAAEVKAAIASGEGRVAEWKYAQPDLHWSALKTRNVLTQSLEAFTKQACENPNASDAELCELVKSTVIGANEAATSNTTARAFQTLLSRATPKAAKQLVRTFLDLRVLVEAREISEEQAAKMALEARMQLV